MLPALMYGGGRHIKFLPPLIDTILTGGRDDGDTEPNAAANQRAIVDNVIASGADIVCLSELFFLRDYDEDNAKEELEALFGGTYEIRLGPRTVRTATNLLDKNVVNSGLVLLTRLPVKAEHRFAYSHMAGGLLEGDTWSSKGILHVRVAAPNTDVDLFFTHTQSEYKASRETTWAALRAQLSDAGWFVRANRDPQIPAFLMGDLNVNATNEAKYAEMIERLGKPVDLWPVANGDADGFTYNDGNNFYGEPKDGGDRIDYIMQWPGSRLIPSPTSMEVLRWQRDSHDISDHFGLRVDFDEAWTVEPEVVGRIAAVEARLSEFRALRESESSGGGFYDYDQSDEVKIILTLSDERGRSDKTESRTDNVDTGDTLVPTPHEPARLNGDPGAHVKLHLWGKEIDSTFDDDLGESDLWLTREDLLLSGGHPFGRVMPRLTWNGADYAVEVEVTAVLS